MNDNDDHIMDQSITSTMLSGAKEDTEIHDDSKEESPALAKIETQNVNRLRLGVGIVLILSTAGIALAIYFFVRHSERSDFEIGYTSDADRLLDGIGMSIHDSLGAMAAFGTMMASIARETNQTFPYVTLPHFAVKASRLLTMTAAIQITIQTVVTSKQRLQWEAYTIQNEWWVNETKAVQDIDQFYYGDAPYGVPNRGVIFNYTSDLPYEPK
jgi:hypothetical protein